MNILCEIIIKLITELMKKSIGVLCVCDDEAILVKRWEINWRTNQKETYSWWLQVTVHWWIKDWETLKLALKREICEEIREILFNTHISEEEQQQIIKYVQGCKIFWNRIIFKETLKGNLVITLLHEVNREIFDILKGLTVKNELLATFQIIGKDTVPNIGKIKRGDNNHRNKWFWDWNHFMFPDELRALQTWLQ